VCWIGWSAVVVERSKELYTAILLLTTRAFYEADLLHRFLLFLEGSKVIGA